MTEKVDHRLTVGSTIEASSGRTGVVTNIWGKRESRALTFRVLTSPTPIEDEKLSSEFDPFNYYNGEILTHADSVRVIE